MNPSMSVVAGLATGQVREEDMKTWLYALRAGTNTRALIFDTKVRREVDKAIINACHEVLREMWRVKWLQHAIVYAMHDPVRHDKWGALCVLIEAGLDMCLHPKSQTMGDLMYMTKLELESGHDRVRDLFFECVNSKSVSEWYEECETEYL